MRRRDIGDRTEISDRRELGERKYPARQLGRFHLAPVEQAEDLAKRSSCCRSELRVRLSLIVSTGESGVNHHHHMGLQRFLSVSLLRVLLQLLNMEAAQWIQLLYENMWIIQHGFGLWLTVTYFIRRLQKSKAVEKIPTCIILMWDGLFFSKKNPPFEKGDWIIAKNSSLLQTGPYFRRSLTMVSTVGSNWVIIWLFVHFFLSNKQTSSTLLSLGGSVLKLERSHHDKLEDLTHPLVSWPFSRRFLDLSPQYIWMKMGFMGTHKSPLYANPNFHSSALHIFTFPAFGWRTPRLCALYCWPTITWPP